MEIISPRARLGAGTFPWQHGTMLAPMEGVTHAGFRNLLASYGGVGVVCTEFVRITRTPLTMNQLRRAVVKSEHAALSVQVMGNDVSNMALATRMVVSAGADVVDINLGCPAPNAVRKGVGAAMLEDLELLHQVVSAMRMRTEGPLSAKMRAGLGRSDRALEIAEVVQDAGVDLLTVHPRCGADGYRGRADWSLIARIKKRLSIPVVGNGDCWCAADALAMLATTGADAVMIGRPAIKNPWIFLQLAQLRAGEQPFAPSGLDVLDHYQRFIACLDVERDVVRLGVVKQHLHYTLRALGDGRDAGRQLLRAQTLGQLWELLSHTLAPLTSGQLELGAHGSAGVAA